MSYILVSPVNPESKDGGGWATRRVIKFFLQAEQQERVDKYILRESCFHTKILYAFQGVLLLPFIHNIFSRYMPIASVFLQAATTNYLFNFSQTFGLAVFFRNSFLICHDLQCHRSFFLKRWVRFTEGFLLRRALRVVVLSDRDSKIVQRLYRVPFERVISLRHEMMLHVDDFSVPIKRTKNPLRVLFLGSLLRDENRSGLTWFVNHVNSKLFDNEVLVYIIGSNPENVKIFQSNFNYIGYVDDLSSEFACYDLMIAPMLSNAGVKVKVIEALEHRLPVLGTHQAYSGISKPAPAFCSSNPAIWIRTLREESLFVYKKMV